MARVNRDVIVAVLLLVFCAALFWASYDIRETSYGTMQSHVWPRIIIVVLAFCSVLYLFRSVVAGPETEANGDHETPSGGIVGWLSRYRNAIICFGLFLAFLFSLEWIGMLLGGILFIFLALTAMGPGGMRSHMIHAAIAVVSMGAMWSIFTFAIGVILPEGELFLPG